MKRQHVPEQIATIIELLGRSLEEKADGIVTKGQIFRLKRMK